jgi:SAM-dependent methyltransferase
VDPIEAFKVNARAGWAHFAPVQSNTTPAAAHLVRFAGIRPGVRVLDVGCGTGVAAVTAARLGAIVTGLDMTPDLLEVAQANARTAGVQVEWREGDAEALPFGDGTFDVVMSQFGHMFALRPELAVAGMLRVLKPGGTIAFSTWPPHLLIGRLFAVMASHLPPPPPGVAPPVLWGEPAVIRERLGAAVHDIRFDMGRMSAPALSPAHYRAFTEGTVGPVVKLVEALQKTDPAKLEAFRRACEALIAEYFDANLVHHDFLMTRGTKN